MTWFVVAAGVNLVVVWLLIAELRQAQRAAAFWRAEHRALHDLAIKQSRERQEALEGLLSCIGITIVPSVTSKPKTDGRLN